MSDHRPVTDLMSDRPFSFIALILAVKDFFFGLGFVFAWAEIRQTLLYQNYDALWPYVAGPVVGVIFVALSLFIMIGVARKRNSTIRHGLVIQASLWLFSALMYISTGAYVLSIIFGLSMSLIPIYISRWMKQPEALERTP